MNKNVVYIALNNNEISVIDNVPFDEKYGQGKTKIELEQFGFFIDYMPEETKIDGKEIIKKYKGGAKKISDDEIQAKIDLEFNRSLIYYEYTETPPIPPTVDDRVSNLELENAELLKDSAIKDVSINILQGDNAQLLKDSAKKDIQLEMLQADVADLVKTIAQGGI